MLTHKRGDEGAPEIETWARRVGREVEPALDVQASYDSDSSTYVLRLIKGSRVLVFRLSEAQAHDPAREGECERILKRKIQDLAHMLDR
ncbi:MAG TPA: hypothetical protein VNN77_19060 [candidate division Zixibacteria bacterium]|nr:hypothetical protein [candidate division Zixibacteria bacterium]